MIIGIGNDAHWSARWFEVVEAPPGDRSLTILELTEKARRIADDALSYVAKLAPLLQEPHIEVGPPFVASFAARVRSGRPHFIDVNLDPVDVKVDARGIAISAARIAAKRAAARLGGFPESGEQACPAIL